MKNKVKIAIAIGGVVVSALATAPAQAQAAAPAKAVAPALSGSCSETFFCAWDANDDLFWSTNAPNRSFPINQFVSYVENLTNYQEEVLADYPQPKGWTYVEIKPHTGLTYIGEEVMLIETS